MLIYLAGGEAWADLLLDMGVKNQLFSYFYFRQSLRSSNGKARTLLARLRKAQEKGYRFMLDSGAFTYQIKQGRGVPPPHAYFDEYLSFCLEYGDLFGVIAEFDVDYHAKENGEDITTEQTNEWTNRFLAEPELALRYMPIHHPYRGARWLNDWLADTRSPYVGLGSDTSSAGSDATVIAKAHRFGKYIHGFAQTRIKTDLKYTPFDSVDSTTWLRADKFGGTMIFQNNKLIVLDHLHKKDRALYREYYRRWGLDFKKIMTDDLNENRLATIVCWREMANAYEQRQVTFGPPHPYLYKAVKDGKRLPTEHPLVTEYLKKKRLSD